MKFDRKKHDYCKSATCSRNSIFCIDCLEICFWFFFLLFHINFNQVFFRRSLSDGERNVQFYVGSCITHNVRCHLIHADDDGDDDNEDGNEKPIHKHTLQNVWAYRCVTSGIDEKNSVQLFFACIFLIVLSKINSIIDNNNNKIHIQ